jgi:ABC-type transport system involved in cytochrome c biogenesis permease subunit
MIRLHPTHGTATGVRGALAFLLLAPWIFLTAPVLPAEDRAQHASPVLPDFPWDAATLDLFASLPIQDEGRVKPLNTYARFTLLRLNGRTSFRTEQGKTLSALEWLLVSLFYPEIARDFKHFLVQDADALVAAGIKPHEREVTTLKGETNILSIKRDRYSYNELAPGRVKLFQLAQQYMQVEAKKRTPVEQQIVNLANNLFTYEQILSYFTFANARFRPTEDTSLKTLFPETDGAPLSVALQRCWNALLALREQRQTLPESTLNAEIRTISALFDRIDGALTSSTGLALLPPTDPQDKVWRTPQELFHNFLNLNSEHPEPLELLAGLEKVALTRDDPPAFRAAVAAFYDAVKAAADARGEYRRIPLEVTYYKWPFLFYAQWLFVLSFVVIAVLWMLPQTRGRHLVSVVMVSLPTLLLIAAITMRCIIRGRPPVSTLYETILFITAGIALTGILIELMNRQRIAIATASFLGAAGMFLAFRYEAKEGVDTMPSLVAVLDTNFWLATHVTTITAGYAAALLSAALAHLYILGKFFGYRKNDEPWYRNVTKMTYGVLCFSLIFSVAGTILGGIWANYSWGRFWGWDPKENGALMICLATLAVLHAKRGRYISDLGTNAGAVFVGMIVAFSWWGVNLLGVGLHSYGFTSGIMNALVVFWILETLVIMLGGIVYLRNRLAHHPVPIVTEAPAPTPAVSRSKTRKPAAALLSKGDTLFP